MLHSRAPSFAHPYKLTGVRKRLEVGHRRHRRHPRSAVDRRFDMLPFSRRAQLSGPRIERSACRPEQTLSGPAPARSHLGGCESESATREDFRSSSVASIVQAPFEKPAC